MNKRKSKPDYDLFENGINEETRLYSVLHKIGDPVLICLVLACGMCVGFGDNDYLIGFCITLIFLWGVAKYIIWADKKFPTGKQEDSR